MINVIWVDDEILNPDGSQTDLCKSVINSAYDEGIDITPFPTYDEAYIELQRNPTKWIAIILDVRNDKASKGNENREFSCMKEKIRDFRREKGNSVEPFIFVFSADATVLSSGLIVKDSELQRKDIYTKPGDTTILFEDIKKITTYSINYSIYTEFKSIMLAMDKLEWSMEEQNTVFGLIKSIEKNNDYKNDSLYNVIRKLLENTLYNKLERVGILDGYEKTNVEDSVDDTINKRSQYMGKNPNIPLYIQRAFHSLTMIAQNGSHLDNNKPLLVVARDTQEGKAPYLLKSCLYDLLTIINWEAQL